MATVKKSVTIAKSAAEIWNAVSDAGQLHTRVAPGMVTNTTLEDGGEVRIVTFGNGMVLKEYMISNDAETTRLAWSAESDQWTHHNASLEIFAIGEGQSEVVWTADVLPHSAGVLMEQFLTAGLGAMKAHMENGPN
jgi:Polyketide cyclase / dehydrase and lipid transport